jgi:hypothetical protein
MYKSDEAGMAIPHPCIEHNTVDKKEHDRYIGN